LSKFATSPRLSFVRPAPTTPVEQPGGRTFCIQGITRREALLHEAAAVLDVLPGPDEALHALITGRYDLMHLIVALLGKLGPAKHVRIATLSYNGRNLAEMFGILDVDAPPSLTLLCSAFFRDHNRELWEETLVGFREHKQRTASGRTHAKVVTLETVAGVKLVIEGSANLRSNSNREQVAIIDAPGLHDWHSSWIDEMVSQHEGENDAEESQG
jgi:hypothetical protein